MNPPNGRQVIRKINGKAVQTRNQGISLPAARTAPPVTSTGFQALEHQVRALSEQNAELKARNQKLEQDLATALARAAAAAAAPPSVDPLQEEIKRDLEKRNQELNKLLADERAAHETTREKSKRLQSRLEQLEAKHYQRDGVPIVAPGRDL